MAEAQSETGDQHARGSRAAPYGVVQLTSTTVIGGTERMVLQLVERLDREHFEPLVLSLVGGGALIEECREHGIEAEFLDCRHPLQWRAWRRFCSIIRQRRVALVHLYGLRANLPGRPLARRAGARAVVAGIRSIDPWRKWYHSALDRWTARWVDAFVSNSEAARRVAIERERFAPSRVVTIHSGVREMQPAGSFDQAALRRQFSVDPSAQPVVAVVANLSPEKRHRDLIDAAALLAERFPGLVFLCAGRERRGMREENQRDAAERGVAGAFRWLGYVADVSEVIAASDFAALPSSHEGLPASILEAMAMGRTVVATPVGGVPEIVRDGSNGLLVPVGQPQELAEAIERLTTDTSLRQRLETAARETIRRDFSIDRMVKQTERLYLELLEGRRKPQRRSP